MFSNLNYQEWLDWVPAISFALIFGVFAFSALWLWKMDDRKSDHAAQLPLEDEQTRPVGKKSR